jgi:hypothetical protein
LAVRMIFWIHGPTYDEKVSCLSGLVIDLAGLYVMPPQEAHASSAKW